MAISRTEAHRQLPLPSQDYNFRLVLNAVDRGAIIILMRGLQRWLRAVPKLNEYDKVLILKNVQQPTISPNNCPRFEEVVRAIGLDWPVSSADREES